MTFHIYFIQLLNQQIVINFNILDVLDKYISPAIVFVIIKE